TPVDVRAVGGLAVVVERVDLAGIVGEVRLAVVVAVVHLPHGSGCPAALGPDEDADDDRYQAQRCDGDQSRPLVDGFPEIHDVLLPSSAPAAPAPRPSGGDAPREV